MDSKERAALDRYITGNYGEDQLSSKGEKSFGIRVEGNDSDTGVTITVDGEKHDAECFEFTAPFGVGLRVKRVTRIELVP